jgi:hypothetical protein
MLLLALVLAQAPLVTETPCTGFSVVRTSPSGEPTEDDERVDVKVGDVTFPVPFAPAMFTSTGVSSTAKQVKCRTDLLAWEVRPDLVVLVLTRSGRPQLDTVSLALVDLSKKKTLQVLETRWELVSGRQVAKDGVRFHFVARAAPGGFDLRVVREWLKDDDSPTGAIEDWLKVRVQKAQLTAGWLRP